VAVLLLAAESGMTASHWPAGRFAGAACMVSGVSL